MYVNPAFKPDDAAAWHFVRQRAFGILTVVDSGTPIAVHAPLLVREEAGQPTLELHVARANPIHQVIGDAARALVVVPGSDAYISPDWYVSEDQVPTWNYMAAHLSGSVHVLPRERAHAHVEALSLAHEARLAPKKPWSTSKMTERQLRMMLAAIVPLEVRVERLEAVFKLSQNKSVPDRHEAARMLEWRGSPGEKAVSRAMLEALRTGEGT